MLLDNISMPRGSQYPGVSTLFTGRETLRFRSGQPPVIRVVRFVFLNRKMFRFVRRLMIVQGIKFTYY